MTTMLEDKIDIVLSHTQVFHGVCSCCGAHEVRSDEGDGKWAAWACECGWFMTAENKTKWS